MVNKTMIIRQNPIPIIMMFNDKYSMPAAVAICSLLENANHNNTYALHVLHEDITNENVELLSNVVSNFRNASIEFLNMGGKFEEQWGHILTKDYYSKECLYKLILPELFKQYDTAIITDVDVVFRGDISPAIEYVSNRYYIAGYRPPSKLLRIYDNAENINEAIRKKYKDGIGAGIMVYNLALMRKDGVQKKLLAGLERYSNVLIQPEQDIINIVLNKHLGYLPLEFCLCTYMYNLFRVREEFNIEVKGHTIDYIFKKYMSNLDGDLVYSQKELARAFKSPIQIHYASGCKPWKNGFTKRKLDWIFYLSKTPYFFPYLLGKYKSDTENTAI